LVVKTPIKFNDLESWSKNPIFWILDKSMWINPLDDALNRYLTAADDIKKMNYYKLI